VSPFAGRLIQDHEELINVSLRHFGEDRATMIPEPLNVKRVRNILGRPPMAFKDV
jgi:hypothetical protein